MQNNRFGRRSYATAVATDDNSDGLVPGVSSRQSMMNRAINEGRNLRKEAESKKRYFQQKLNLEGNRKKLGKGNIITFLINDENQGIEKSDINKVLRISGFSVGDVEGIKLNDFRSNQVEVLLKPGLDVDVQQIEERLRKANIDAAVSKFDHVEEFIMIYGLPLTSDMENLESKILDALKPFVKKVLEIVPMKHKEENSEDFFAGHYNGNWRVKVCPKDKLQVPNFIVVGQNSQVMGKAVYTRKVSPKEEMCSDCFSTQHFKKAPDCPGLRDWSDYCKEFERNWTELSLEEVDIDDVIITPDNEEVRMSVLSKTLINNVERLENDKIELVNRLKEREMSIQKVDDLQSEVDVLVNEKAELEKERKELFDTVKKQEVTSSKVDELEKEKIELEHRLNDISREAEENSKILNQTVRTISDENKELKVNLAMIAAEKTNLETEKIELEKTIEDHHALVNEKHVTFQRIGSQNKLIEFNELDSSVENSPVATDDKSDGLAPEVSSRQSMINRAMKEGRNLRKEVESKKRSESEGKGTPSRSPGPALEKSELNEADTLDKKRALESPGNSPPDKRIGNYPEVGKKIWVQMKDKNKSEYFVQSKKNKNTFNVLNSEGLKTSKNFRDLTWGYISEEGGSKNSK